MSDPSRKSKLRVLFTKHRLQKKKVWHDGSLELLGSRATLRCENDTVLEESHLARPIAAGDEFQTERYLVQVDEDQDAVGGPPLNHTVAVPAPKVRPVGLNQPTLHPAPAQKAPLRHRPLVKQTVPAHMDPAHHRLQRSVKPEASREGQWVPAYRSADPTSSRSTEDVLAMISGVGSQLRCGGIRPEPEHTKPAAITCVDVQTAWAAELEKEEADDDGMYCTDLTGFEEEAPTDEQANGQIAQVRVQTFGGMFEFDPLAGFSHFGDTQKPNTLQPADQMANTVREPAHGSQPLLGQQAAAQFAEVARGATHAVSYTHLRAHETPEHLVCRLLLEKKNNRQIY
eukprot:TRINITY_DN21101_c0_g1_i1.p1 TRINITY_DN21101_c0_g1~~TRINITY_DN21101_c0_g1_i1.p1  ORF type:complete len:342 (-),score=59.01 TRINITY_DN21101_c0_g1_i1:48-1073(-)